MSSFGYFVSNGSYLRWTVGGGAVDDGYPKPVANGWTNIGGTGFEGGFDAAVDLGQGFLYFFLGGSYLRVRNSDNTVDSGVESIGASWRGMADVGFGEGIDAAVNYGDGTAYFFKGDQYVAFSITDDQVSAAPSSIAADWPGLADVGFGGFLDAAVNWGNGDVYFFRGDQYATFSIADNLTTAVGPLSEWTGFPEAGFGSIQAAWVKLAAGGGAVVPPPPPGRIGVGDCVWYHNSAEVGPRVHVGPQIPRMQWFPGANPADKHDYQNHGKEIFEYVVHADAILRGQPHMKNAKGSAAWLNRNPGNIVTSGTSYGEYPGKSNWHSFRIFPTYEIGFAAIGRLLREKFNGHTILQTMEAYAPLGDGDNNPVQYAADVAAAAGVTPDTVIGTLNEDQLLAVMRKIEVIEGYVAGDTLAVDSPEVPPEVRSLLA